MGMGPAEKPPAARRRLPRMGPLYVVEHMEEGVEEWCRLEYTHMCEIVPRERLLFLRWPAGQNPAGLMPPGTTDLPRVAAQSLRELRAAAAFGAAEGCDGASSESASPRLPPWERVCLLDMDAEEALEPGDAASFDALVFGGILGNVHEKEDGSYGSDDRTSELRTLGFAHRRHLGPLQMTTDTAVLVSHLVLEEARPLAEIPFIDSPEIGGGNVGGAKEAEPSDCVCMEGFRYVARRSADGDWEPALPKGMPELLVRSADNDILGSL